MVTSKTRMDEAMEEALASVDRVEAESTQPADSGIVDPSDATEIPVELDDEDVIAVNADEVVDADAGGADMASMKEQLLRLAADFENFRKRAHRDQEALRKFGIEQVMRGLLPVIDNLTRALEHSDESPFSDGVKMVAKQFSDTLAEHGVKSFKSVGDVFDPELHEAMGQAPTEDAIPGTVFQEMETGFMLHDRLLRPAKVLVAMKPESPQAAEDTQPEETKDPSGLPDLEDPGDLLEEIE